MGRESWRDLSAEIHPGQVHHQGWYAVALSSEVEAGRVLGREFLNGRVAIYRTSSGTPVVLTSRCPHMGADLALGDVVGDELRCTYHHFRFGSDGACAAIPSAGPIPPSARVFSYPCAEHLGLIWAFNGETPLFSPPAVRGFESEKLLVRARRTNLFSVAPWLSVGNSFDFMHLRYVHGLSFEFDPEKIRWLDEYRVEYDIEFDSPALGRFEQKILVTGTNAVSYVTVADTTTIGLFTSTPIGSAAQSYYVAGVLDESDVEPQELERRLQRQERLADDLLADDSRTLTGIRFKVGTLLKEDRSMVKFLRWVSEFPKAAPAADFE